MCTRRLVNGLIRTSEAEPKEAVMSESAPSPSGVSLLPRRIEFHQARKTFTGFSNGRGDFQLEVLNPASEASRSGDMQGSTSVQKLDAPEKFENILDPELSFGMRSRRIGAGLQNLGNTCFLNSVLQCLTYTEPLAAYLQSGKHQMSCRIAGFCALCAIQKHVSCALQSTGRILAPKDLVSNLRCISRSFRNARQEDAHEYMVNLLQSMHKCCLPSGVSGDTPNAYEKSLVHRIFGGRLRSQVKCQQCSYCSNKFDLFLDLSLEIVKAESLNKALMHFTAPEELDGGERQYHCQRCQQKVRALKQLTVYQAPYVLTIHLKRFAAHDPGRKIDKKVCFDPTLDLKPFVSGSNEGELMYTLYGVLVHAGWSTHSGHYYCFVRTSTGMWYSLDDNRVFQVNERTVLEQKAYMVFYVRDRKNAISKVPFDVQKGNLGSNMVQNKRFSTNLDPKEETVPNVSSMKKVDEATFAAMPQKDAMDGSSNGSILNLASASNNINGQAKTDLSHINMEPALLHPKETISQAMADCSSIKAPPFKLNAPFMGPKKSVSNLETDNGKCCPVKAAVVAGTELNCCIDGKSSIGNLEVSVPLPSACNDTNDYGVDKLISEEIHQKDVCIVTKCFALNSVSGKAGEGTRELGEGGLAKSCGPLVPARRSFDAKSDRKLKKFKKKPLKYSTASVYRASMIFLGASLSIQKKNRKRSRHSLGAKHLSQENLCVENDISADPGPSTSEKTERHSLSSTHLTRKRLDPSRADKAVDSVGSGYFDREPRGRVVLDGCKQPENAASFGTMTSNQLGNSGVECLEVGRRCSLPNGSRNILSSGLEVGRWDDDRPPEMLESSYGDVTSIGYVPDEWDEEYDRGKRKKVRQLREFVGTNLFQQFANMKARKKSMRRSAPDTGLRV